MEYHVSIAAGKRIPFRVSLAMSGEKEYQITHAWEDDILVITITGRATPRNANDISADVFQITNALRPKYLLTDCRSIQGRLTAGETYQHVRKYPKRPFSAVKSAVLDLEENRPSWSFHETTMANAGLDMRYFTDRDEALAWLRTPSESAIPCPQASPQAAETTHHPSTQT